MLHLPGPRFVTIRAAGERPDGTDVDARAALIAVEMIAAVRNDLCLDTAISDAQRLHPNAFVANANAAVAENAAGRIIKHDRRPLALVIMMLDFDEPALARAVAERHVLQFAFTALVAHGTIER